MDEPDNEIKCIDKQSILKICSGQSIVSLATAVKELVENALDASATTIIIKLKECGKDCIEVSDNGTGVDPSNHEGLALKHHTSKLRDFTDLNRLCSFGFRGEALSSICQLSGSFTICTRTKFQSSGYLLEFSKTGALVRKTPAARAVGTTVTISDLFKPLPVRHLDFERHLKKHYAKLLRVLQGYAIITSGVRLSCINIPRKKGTQQMVINTQPNKSIHDSVANVFGSKFSKSLLEVNILLEDKSDFLDDDDDFETKTTNYGSVVGVVSKVGSGVGRCDNDRQFFFINGRPVDLPKMSKAVNEVWRQYEMKQKPACVLNFLLPSGSFDVNVTPDKREVFITEEHKILDFVKEGLNALWEPLRGKYTVHPTLHGFTNSSNPSVVEKKICIDTLEEKKSNENSEKISSQDKESVQDSQEIASTPVSSSLASWTESDGKAGESILDNSKEDIDQPTECFLFSECNQENNSQPKNGVESNIETADRKSLRFDKKNNAFFNGVSVSSSLAAEKVTGGSENDSVDERIADENDSVDEVTVSENDSAEEATTSDGITPDLIEEDHQLNSNESTASDSMLDDDDQLDSSAITPRDSMLDDDDDPSDKPTLLSVKDIVGELGKALEKEGNGLRKWKKPGIRKVVVDSSLSKQKSITEAFQGGCSPKKSLRTCSTSGRSHFLKNPKEITNPSSVDIVGMSLKTNSARDHSSFCMDNHECAAHDSSSSIYEEDQERKNEFSNILNDKILNSSSEKKRKNLENSESDMFLKGDLQSIKADRLIRRKQFKSEKISSNLPEDLHECCSTNVHDNEAAAQVLERVLKKESFRDMEILGQFNLGFILTRLGNDVFIIDQHASDEKYNFEKLQKTTRIHEQKLICARTLELTAVEEITIMDNLDIFKKNGFHFLVDESASATMRLKLVAVPFSKNTQFGIDDIQELVSLLMDSPGKLVRLPKAMAMFASRACRSSVMIGTALSREEMEKIVHRLADLDQPWNCPHGRPTMRHLINLSASVLSQ